jgi:putative addiction module component (TIGR02574 family)
MPYIAGMITHDQIAELTAAERISLIAELWDSIADADAPLPQAQRDELLRRLGTFEIDGPQAQNWDALKAELDARRR